MLITEVSYESVHAPRLQLTYLLKAYSYHFFCGITNNGFWLCLPMKYLLHCTYVYRFHFNGLFSGVLDINITTGYYYGHRVISELSFITHKSLCFEVWLHCEICT